ncbi:MAG: DNA repair protein RecO [Candidatus Levybacteria bacterium]|nr:DNA repair protein RecO [Candidatus Levybacteria bacterium]
MRTFRTEGFVIKRKNMGEADRMLTVFTKEHGKIQVKARGIRKIPSRRSAHVELVNRTLISVYKGHKIPVLVEAQMIEDYDEIKRDLNKIGFAYHICELIDGLCAENVEQARIFYLLKKVFERMRRDEDLAPIIHDFEIQLLTELGFWNKSSALSARLDTKNYIENILERRLKSKSIFSKIS